ESRLSLAQHALPARARPHRHLQSLVLRGGARGPRAPRAARAPASAEGARDPWGVGGAPRGHSPIRVVSRAAGGRDSELLSQSVAQGTEAAVSRSPRPAGEELEVLDVRREGAGLLEELHARV